MDPNIVKNPSSFNPPAHRDTILDTYIDYITKYPFDEILKRQAKVKPNLKKQEWNAIMDLKNDEDLIIKESDKGSACIIMDKEYYKNKI